MAPLSVADMYLAGFREVLPDLVVVCRELMVTDARWAEVISVASLYALVGPE